MNAVTRSNIIAHAEHDAAMLESGIRDIVQGLEAIQKVALVPADMTDLVAGILDGIDTLLHCRNVRLDEDNLLGIARIEVKTEPLEVWRRWYAKQRPVEPTYVVAAP